MKRTCSAGYYRLVSACLCPYRQLWLLAIGLAALAEPARGLVKFDDGHDEIFVTGTAGVGYDSNLFAVENGQGATSYTGSLLIDYKRHAGMLGVNASLGWDFGRFQNLASENFANPTFKGEIDKSSGRTTGALTFSVAKESRADVAINVRTTSWDYNAGLNLRYPVIERYSVAGDFGYNRRDFTNNQDLVDINVYQAGADLLYALNSERNLLAGYRIRDTHTTADTTSYDHSFTVGTTGKILPKLNGSLRAGYQFRQTDRQSGTTRNFNAFTASADVNWTVSKRLSVVGRLSKDFSTVATDAGLDTTSGALTAQYAVNSKLSAFGTVSGGYNRFLDSLSTGRHDTFFSYEMGTAFVFNDHLKLSASYLFYQNWSTLRLADFTRHSISLNLSSRW